MKMTDIMKKSHSESKSENLDAILQKIDNKAFITNSADSAHTETKPQPIKLRRKSVGIAAAAACAAIAVGAFAFSGLLKPDIDATTPAPSAPKRKRRLSNDFVLSDHDAPRVKVLLGAKKK